ncbi:retropepsin-like aspartic protease family protein [Marinimicrobium sp. ARAG 43.8]|uniref:retropepsin-like aspartic protease family protein n=1 Tax=Marinimicrobium sp. ARAG 43.8 TaxID=3418719 RepID=UPI003CF6C40F
MTQDPLPGQQAGRGMLIAAWVVGLALLTWVFGLWEERKHNPNRSPESRYFNGTQEVVLQRNTSGHYVASGSINGYDAVFLLDTGATDVVVSQDLAERAGLSAGIRKIAQTANGRIEVRATRLDRLQLGGIELRDVSASINPAMGGQQVLLGMSALGQVEFSQQDDRLTLRYRGN